MTQRFVSGLDVFDTYSGSLGTIQEMNLGSNAIPPLAPLFTGPYFSVLLKTPNTLQTFTQDGKRIDHTTGVPLLGITLLTLNEYNAAVSVSYPPAS
jgi:hypothetical protein